MTFGKAWESQLLRAPNFWLAPRRLDYLLSRGVPALSARVDQQNDGDGYASDHALVWGRFRSAPRAAERQTGEKVMRSAPEPVEWQPR